MQTHYLLGTYLNVENQPGKIKAEKEELGSISSSLGHKLTTARIQEVKSGLRWSQDDNPFHQPPLEVHS